MNTNNPSNKNRAQRLEKDVNESTSESRNLNDPNNKDKNRAQQSSQTSNAAKAGDYRSSKGTGMSSEAGSAQSEQSWQGTGGSLAGQQNEDETRNYDNKATGNRSNDDNASSVGQRRSGFPLSGYTGN